MATRDVFQCIVLAAACLSVPAEGQRLVVLPGAASASPAATVYTTEPFASAGTLNLNGAPGAFLAFSDPAGSRYFIVTSSNVVVVDSSGAQVQSPLSLAQPVTSAALTPDGSRLIVVAGAASSGSINIFDTTAATIAPPLTLTLSGIPLDVATDLSSTKAYVVDSATLTSVDLTKNVVSGAASLAGLAPSGAAKPGVTVGPNGLVYVSAQGFVYELHPETLATLKAMAVAGFAGKLSFTNDAKVAAAANQFPGSPIATVLNLVGHTTTDLIGPSGVRFNKVIFAGSSRMYATTPDLRRYLYSFSAPDYTVGTKPLDLQGIYSVAQSCEHASSHYLFTVDATGTTRLDVSSATMPRVTAPLASQTTAGPAFYFPANTAGYAVSFAQYNATQTLRPSATSLPLVVRLLDSDGNGVPGQPVSWSVAPGVTLMKGAARTTNAQGFAVATAVVPARESVYNVSASFAGTSLSQALFALSVSNPGGNPGTNLTSGIALVSGNGQVVLGGDKTAEPLVVSVADSAGKPVASAPVTFAVQPGSNGAFAGQFDTPTSSSGCQFLVTQITCPTDANGRVSVSFVGPYLGPTSGAYTQTTILASTPAAGGNVTFRVSTVPVASLSGTKNYLPTVTTIKPLIGNQITGQTGQTIQGAFEVLVRTQPTTIVVPVPNVGLWVRSDAGYAADATAPPAHCAAASGIALSNTAGSAVCNLVLGFQPGTYTIWRIVGGYDMLSYTLTITAPPAPTPVPTTIVLTTGEGQTAAVGESVNLVGTVKDQNGKIMADTTARWSVALGTATIAPASSKTDTNGQIAAAVKVGAAGPIQIKLTAGTASGIFHLTGTIPISSLTIVSGDQQSTTVGTAFAAPLVVQVTPASAGLAVAFTATGGATLSAPSVNTDANGQAIVNVTAGPSAGAIQVTATAGGLTQTFNLTSNLPGPVLDPVKSFLNGASFAENYLAFGSVATIKTAGLTTGLDLQPGSCLSDGTIGGLPVTGGLPTRIAGVEFQIGSKLAPIFAICKNEDGTEQANIQVPFEVAPVKSWGVVRYNAGTPQMTEFSTSELEIRNAAPGIFEYYVSDSTLGAVAVKADGSVISPGNPAHPGDTIEVYVTGLGPVLPTAASNVPGAGQKVYFTPTVELGGRQVATVAAEYAHNGIGIYLVTFQIPQDQAAGDTVDLKVGVLRNDKTTADSQTSHIAIK